MMRIILTDTILNKHLLFGTSRKEGTMRRLSCREKLELEIKSTSDPTIIKLLKFLEFNLDTILVGSPSKLNKIISSINKTKLLILPNDDKKWNVFLSKCTNVFVKDYEEFVARKVGANDNWCAYKYVEELNLTICPYCNSQFIFHLNSDKGRTRPVLDHYFDKATYPFLAISIQNLIPCCKVCNSDFKGTTRMQYGNFLHPLEEGFGEKIFFERKLITKKDVEEEKDIEEEDKLKNIDHLSAILGENQHFKLEINYHNSDRQLNNKVKRNNDLFKIEEIYNNYHKKYVNDLVIKTRIYNDLYLSDLSETYSMLFNDLNDLKFYLIPSVVDENSVLLSKLTRDIVNRELE